MKMSGEASPDALPRVFLSRRFPPPHFDELKKSTEFIMHAKDVKPSPAGYRRAVRHADILISMVGDAIDADFLDAAPRLKLVANCGVGFNNIDMEEVTKRGVLATNTPGVVTEPTAECAMALLLAVGRRVVEADSYIRTGKWKGWTPTLLEGRGLNGRVLGVIGLGRIGCAVARTANAFGMRVRYWSRNRKSPEMEEEVGVSYRSFRRLLRESDFLSVHLALNDATHHLIGAEEFALMKKGAVIINTARGPILDEEALVEALRSGRLGGAGLDVFEHEPRPQPRLMRMKNVVMMPHLGTNTDLGRDAVSGRVERNVNAYLLGKRPPDLLNPEAWPHRRR